MAIATSTALALGGLAATAATTTASFVQAGKQKEAQRQAERDADEAMQKARKQLETNFYAQQAIKKEPYELEREALLSQGAQAIEAGVESERGAAATAGRVQMAQQQGQGAIRTAMGQELTDLENKQLAEQSRLRDVGVQLDLGEVAGAQLAARNAQELASKSMQQGFQGLTSLGSQAVSLAPLYDKQSIGGDGISFSSTNTPGNIQSVVPTSKLPQAPQYFKGNVQSPVDALRSGQNIPQNIQSVRGGFNFPQAPQSFKLYNNIFDIYGRG